VTNKSLIAVGLSVLVVCPCASAQSGGPGVPDVSKAPVRVGPLWLNPTIALTNLGVDTNVFHEPEDQHPKQDFTFTLTPTTDAWLHLGRTWVTGKVTEDLTWYQSYASERTANSSCGVGWVVPLTRLSVTTGYSYRNARDRPGFEIDARSQRKEIAYDGAVELRAFSKTFIGATASRRRVSFDKDAIFLGSNLQYELNRRSTTAGLTLRYRLTPLTSVSLGATRQSDRFEFSSLRDSDSNDLSLSVNFDPFALIKGSATFGYRDLMPASAGLPGFKGATTALNLSYTMRRMSRFTVRASRNIEYSYEIDQPYYLLTGADVSVSQHIAGPFDVVGRVGRQSLAYRNRAGGIVEVSRRTDNVRSYGAGVVYRIGRQLRLGVNVDKSNRLSSVSRRRYNNLTFGSSVTYGS
jgi:hypothetical protein